MKGKIEYIVLIFFVVFFACQQLDLPNPSEHGTKYELRGYKDGKPFYIGLDSLHIEMSTSATLNPHSIWIAEGILHNNLTNQSPSLYIGLMSMNITSSMFNAPALVSSGNRRLFNPHGRKQTLYPLEIEIKSDYDINIDSLVLRSNNQHQHVQSNITYLSNKINLNADLHYSTSRADTCLKTSNITIHQNGVLPGVNWSVIGDPYASAVKLKAEFISNDNKQVTYKWSTGETGPFIEVSRPGKYKVTVITQTGQEYIHEKYLYKTVDGAFHTYANSLHIIARWHNEVERVDTIQLGSSLIEYRDNHGKLYTLCDNQPEDAYFTIESIENEAMDRQGKIIINTRVSFTALLRHENETVKLENVTGLFAFGIPQ
jgi:hypothetical protein